MQKRMKKLIFMLIAALSVALTGCSAFDSDPIKPKIIGTGNLQYEAKSGTWFVVVDSTQYTVAETQSSEPVEGMLVTIFTSPRRTGVQAVNGKQSVEQIEELYHRNYTFLTVIAVMCLGLVLVSTHENSKRKSTEVPVVNADV